ncbi:toprim domain-containing protein [Candidatus Woesearchaeota archaeon]|nr:toprim domain-containing protein [Candidatus Woesearchaeota archaeon]
MDYLESWIEKLRQTDALILVEGKKDMAALAELGITHVMQVKGRPLYQVVEAVAAGHKECILLVDLDKEGRKLFAYFTKTLSERGIRINNEFRLFLFRTTELRQIEGLAKYVRIHMEPKRRLT